jgi:hypothetical protein
MLQFNALFVARSPWSGLLKAGQTFTGLGVTSE